MFRKNFLAIVASVFLVGGIGWAVGPTTIGEWVTSGPLYVSEGPSGVATVNDFGIVIESDNNAALAIHTPNTNFGLIHFGDPEDDNEGAISYNHNNGNMDFITEGAVPLTVLGDGGLVLTAQVDGASGCPDGGNICSGTYTPSDQGGSCTPGNLTFTNPWHWTRVGNVVSVHGVVAQDCSSGVGSVLISLPIGSSLANSSSLSGTMATGGGLANRIIGSGSFAEGGTGGSAVNDTWAYTFQYVIQ